MTFSSIAEQVESLIAIDETAFTATVAEEVEIIKRELEAGTFDNPQSLTGMEFELYAVDSDRYSLRRIPRRLLSYIGFEKELGLHNAELQTNPNPLNQYGLRTQLRELQARVHTATTVTRADDIRLVSDGMWTIPPTGETAIGYLTDYVEVDGIKLATNMSRSIRYQAFSNVSYAPRMNIEAPHVSVSAETPMLESLITSIQPHYQVPNAVDLPSFFNYAIRAAAPILALGVNSPFFPPELYDDVPGERILDDAWMENRILIFESVMNPVDGPEKVKFPRDIGTVSEAVDRIAADPVVVPKHFDSTGRFDDQFRHFRHKHGSYWRWIRPVFEGPTRGQANARIEFRPLPAQPTIPDSVGFQALFCGVLESLYRHDHPVHFLDWETARANFYEAAEHGLEADLQWITINGEETNDPSEIFSEIFDLARDGLDLRSLPKDHVDGYLSPIEARFEHRVTPARWKHAIAREHIENGEPLSVAIPEAQRAYFDQQFDSLIQGNFTPWVA